LELEEKRGDLSNVVFLDGILCKPLAAGKIRVARQPTANHKRRLDATLIPTMID
jgi:hypothetical protein